MQLNDLIDLDSRFRKKFSQANYEISLSEGVLTVKSEQVNKKYVLVKVPGSFQIEQEECVDVIYADFHLRTKKGETFAAFNEELLENYEPPDPNNFNQLKVILQTLAKVQAKLLVKYEGTSNMNQKCLIADSVKIFANPFTGLNQEMFERTSEKLQADLDKLLLKTHLLVPSLWCLPNNVYVNSELNVVFLHGNAQKHFVPPVLDALLYLFSLTNEHFRQKHYKFLMKNYFDSLEQELKVLHKNIRDSITEIYKDLQVRILLPVVKVLLISQAEYNSTELLDNLSNYYKYPLINQEEIYEIVSKKLQTNDFNLINYNMTPLTEKNGHLGEYYFLKVTIQDHNILDFFCKFLTTSTGFKEEMIETKSVGKTENFFYGTLYPLYEKHDLKKLLDFAPKCYLHGITGYMVLDNLSSEGFSTLKPNTILNLDGLKAILSKLAKYHASSIILEEQLSKEAGKQISLYDIYQEYLDEKLLVYDGIIAKMIDNNIIALMYMLEKFPDLAENINMVPDKVKEVIKDIAYSVLSVGKKSDHIRNVINHGDLYVGNTLIKYRNNNSVLDGILIDFQLVRYFPPAYEVLFFIFLTSAKEERDKHLQLLLDWYYNNLSRHLKEFNLDPDKIYSREDFQKNVNQDKSIAISMAFAYGHLVHIDPDLREELFGDQKKCNFYVEEHRREMIDLCWKDDHYRNVVKGLMEDIVEVVKNGFK
ncbi:uncharacterized protein LOC126743656 [Anthonomus grandis grandis]|uniref:uncharacterized protein LOC126743656 n=1 Tax=Anthonomus grandis grandis TaxID=2921223 RepID=UPI002166309E|nr:uncharacterized protein LOC126743656 [Anthonomus grandis grandis]